MNNKYLLLIAFVFVAVAQIYVPASMVLEREDILTTGKTFKFRTAPVDPNDPMRGKYITLSFDANSFKTYGEQQFNQGENVFVHLKDDLEGFVEIENISAENPGKEIDFVKAEIWYINYNNDTSDISISYPFDRYYMEESKALKAETMYAESLSDSTTTTYAVVKIKDGEAVLEDVMIDGISIKELVGSPATE